MSGANVFGPIVTGGMVERAVVDFLSAIDPDTQGTWISTYLGEIERLEGYAPNFVERPRGIVTSSEFEKWPEDQLPVILVICAGLAGPPERQGDSSYRTRWAVGIAPVVSATNTEETRKLALAYCAAVRAAVVQNKSLDGFTDGLRWVDENFTDFPHADTRTISAGRVVVEVAVANTVREAAGPAQPLHDPTVDPGPWPDATVVDTKVTPKRLTEAVH